MKVLRFLRRKERAVAYRSSISSLAPKVLTKQEDIEKIRPYLNKLKETLDAKGVNNIALTGGYGSGKSTILNTFKALHPEYIYLNVSLASFNQNEGKLPPCKKEELERLLEVSILQQIIYHVKPARIPESRFKRIVNREWWQYLFIAVLFLLWVVSLILSFKYGYLDKINPSSWKSSRPFDWSAFSILTIAFSGIGMLSTIVMQLFTNSKINKVNIKGEVELGEKVDKSVFNEHLEEILYFFERTDYNVVIIEDLDRFDNTDIFTKLREINILLNNSSPIKSDREINFVYALGDNLFKDKKERVKFFDYIIPVIPFINSSNADEQLQRLLREAGLDQNLFSKDFTSDVVTFIDDIDMRLLINIFHEFVIYRQALKPEFIKKPEELFSIITYKNLEPEDYNKLNNREGKLYNLIANKKVYIKDLINTIEDKIRRKAEKINEIESQHASDIRELRAIYVNHVISKIPPQAIFDKSVSLLDDENFQKILDGHVIYQQVTYNPSYRQYTLSNEMRLDYNFGEIQKDIHPTYDYSQRAQLLDDKKNGTVDRLKKEIEELKARKFEVESWDLKQIFQEVGIDQYLSDFTNNDLIRNLVLNGYINENYNDYISLFHEGSITKEDLAFERNVKAGHPPNFTYKLHKIEGLIERIDLRYFNRESILNFDLLDYLGINIEKYPTHYALIVQLLSNEKEKSITFINEYVKNEERPILHFIEKVTGQWKNFFHYVVEESVYDRDVIDNYLRLILTYAKKETILNNQAHEPLVEMISTNPTFLSLVKNGKNVDFFGKITGIIKELDIKFGSLSAPSDNTKKLFDYVYQNNHYAITAQNVLQMLDVYGENVDIEAFNTKNYSTIQRSGLTHLVKYISLNINSYIRNVYLNIDTNTQEDEDYLIQLLNNKDIQKANKQAIIGRTETIISDISQIDDEELQVFALTNDKVLATWENIYEIHKRHGEISEDIIDFVNNDGNAKRLSSLPVSQQKDEGGKMPYIRMWKDLLASQTLSFESFEYLLNSANIRIRYFDFEYTAKDRLEVMVANKRFAFENQVFDKLEEFHSLGLAYLENHKKEVLAVKGNFSFGEAHLSQILSSKKYAIEEINHILASYDITNWSSYSFLLNLQHRLAEDQGLNINPTKIIEAARSQQDDPHNVKILNNYFAKFSKTEVRSVVELLNDEEYQKYLSTNLTETLKLEHQPYNDVLFDLMKANNYIGEKSKRTKKGYQIFKNKNTTQFK